MKGDRTVDVAVDQFLDGEDSIVIMLSVEGARMSQVIELTISEAMIVAAQLDEVLARDVDADRPTVPYPYEGGR